MEHYAANVSFTISSLELLNDFSAICTINLNNMSSVRCGGNKSTVWVHCHSSNFSIVRWDDEIDALVDDIIKNFERTLLLGRQTNNFRNRLFCLRKSAQSSWIRERVNLLYQLEGDEVENKGLLVEHNNHHVLSQFDIHNKLIGVECDLGSIFLLVIVPNYHFIPLLLIDQHDDICFIHHFD